MSKRDDYAQEVAERVIKALEAGTAPWQKPWAAGTPARPGEGMPFNAISGKGYRGGNAVNLMLEQQARGYADDRWLTYKQAADMGCQVRKGMKGATVQYWKFDGGREGEPRTVDKADRKPPMVFTAKVFNGDQIDGMPKAKERDMPTEAWRHDEAERLLLNSGASIRHNGGDRAFYRPGTDSIHLPAREAFPTGDTYYATALHELGHWTGAKGRLDRDLTGSFGSESYAREELRAELSSMMAGERLGLGHDPSQHVAYVGHWIKLLKEDPKEILRAAADAEKICQHLGIEGYERSVMQKVEGKTVTLTPEKARENVWSPFEKEDEALAAKLLPQAPAPASREQGWSMTM